MDLSQVPRGPIGSIDDPLADPYDVPTYGFGFRTPTYQRREDADPSGRVTGKQILIYGIRSGKSLYIFQRIKVSIHTSMISAKGIL